MTEHQAKAIAAIMCRLVDYWYAVGTVQKQMLEKAIVEALKEIEE
jgi:hypothetical protein